MIEEFRDYEFDGMNYKVSNFGRVFGVRGELKQRFNEDGYPEVTLGKLKSKRTRVKVYRIVAEAFIPNPNSLAEVNHIDMDRKNPRVDNLEWVTHQQNIEHSRKNGKYKGRLEGAKNIKAVLSEDDVLNARKMYSDGFKISEITKKLDSKYSTIFNIVKRKTWTHI